MSKPTKIVNVVQRRTAKEIDLSIEMLKRKILNLNVGTYRLSHVTPSSIPDIDVNVFETRVVAKFLCDKNYSEHLFNTIGSRALEYIESSLQETYEYLSRRKEETEQMALDVINKVSGKTKEVVEEKDMPKTKMIENSQEPDEWYPKHKLKAAEEEVIFAGHGEEDGSMVRITIRVKNKADDVNFVAFTMLRVQEVQGKKKKKVDYVTMDSVVGDIKANTEGTLQLVVPNDLVIKVKSIRDGIRLRILNISEEPKQN